MTNDDKQEIIKQARKRKLIAHFLIDNGANLCTADSNGWTLLHTALHRGYRVVKLLPGRCDGVSVDVLNKAK